ncbi:MAG: hypothetical protein L0Z73_05395 [Gammaproteobacteria bacterium]|nr:hypothetical protein [Gammaproteobacteria bacterium]
MKKALLGLVILLIVVIAGGLYYVFTNLDTIAETAIEKYGSEATRTAVQVENVKISLAEGSATINGLSVANPEGFSLPTAFSLGEITTDINLDKTTGDLIVIDLINIAAPEVFYEINAERKGSLNVLKDNLDSGTTGTSPASTTTESSVGSTMTLDITRFVIQDAGLHAKVVPLNNKTYDLKLPALPLNNLKGTPEQISRQILGQLIEHAKKEIKKQGLDKELAVIKAEVQKRVDAEKARLQEKADLKLKAEEEKVQDQLKKLLGN